MPRRHGQLSTMDLVRNMREMRMEHKADYAASRQTRYRRVRSGLGGSADAHVNQSQLFVMREFSRAMDRDDALIGQMIDRACDSIVNTGFTLEPDTGDDALNQDIKAAWLDWAGDPAQCDIAGELTFADMEWLGWRHGLVDGDHFVLTHDSGCLQMIEGDRCQSPRSIENRNTDLILGVLKTKTGKPLQYWFAKNWRRLQHTQVVADCEQIDRLDKNGDYQVCHVVDRRRVSQTRGLPVLKSVFDTAGMTEDVQFALLVKQQVSSLMGIIWKRSTDAAAANIRLGNQSQMIGSSGDTITEEELRAGLMVKAPAGCEPFEWGGKIPSTEVMEHLRWLVRIIGAQLHLPYFMSVMDSSQTVFHGYRGENDLHRRSAIVAQTGYADRLHRPVYRWWLRRQASADSALAAAMARDTRRFFVHAWIPPRWGYIQPEVDVVADERRLNALMASPRMIAAERGHNRARIIAETIADNEQAIIAAIQAVGRIKQKTGQDVHWTQALRLTAGKTDIPDNWTGTPIGADGKPVAPGKDPSKQSPDATGKTPRQRRAQDSVNRMAHLLNGVHHA